MIEKPFEVKSSINEKYRHLKEGVLPIIACVGTIKDFRNDKRIGALVSDQPIPNAHDVDFYSAPQELKEKGFESGERDSYVISPTDSFDKYSRRFYNCIGLVVTGTEKETGKNISFMSHQNPEYFLLERNALKFSEDLIKKMQKIGERCKSGTIDAIILGGSYVKIRGLLESDPDRNMYIEEYLKSIQFLSKKVKDEIGFEPLIIAGPKTVPGSDHVFYDNENRRLYLLRDQADFGSIQSFTLNELEERRKNWKPGEWGLPV